MAIKIGHASIDENKSTKNGKAGDQTGLEVCIRPWYSKPWTFVLRCKDSSKAEIMAAACENSCANSNIGYDQNQRNSLRTQAKKVNFDISKITVPCECDCSSFVTVCAEAAGINIPYNGTNAPTTSTMRTAFTSTGMFEVLTASKYLTSDKYLKRGDILVKPSSHTVMALENGINANSNDTVPPVQISSVVKGVDISSYQGNINWNTVKQTGVDHAVLKVIRKDLSPDKKFEDNWNGCKNSGVNIIGVYNYSYAATVVKAKSDANKVLSILNGRKTKVWLDVEDDCQKNLGSLLKDIINAYQEVIESAGYSFGVYTGQAFYKSYIKPYESQINCTDWWIARYYNGYNKMNFSVNPNETYNPKLNIGKSNIYAWQYTSSGQVNGISGNVDLNVIYTNQSTNNSSVSSANETSIEMLGKVTTKSDNLNIRISPNSNSTKVGSYPKGKVVSLIAKTSNGWYKVRTANGVIGYISGKYVKVL